MAVQKNRGGSMGRNSIDQFNVLDVLLLSQALKKRGDVYLIGLVISGQCIHHNVDASPERHFPLVLPPGNRRVKWLVLLIQCPGSGQIV